MTDGDSTVTTKHHRPTVSLGRRVVTGAPRQGDVPLDLAGIAVLLEVHEATPKTWRQRGALPPPDGRLGRSDYWWQSTIEAWHDARVVGRAARQETT